ncbi:GntT/GntP/DsdX family permease [Brevibacterium yomogidense]|uniref:GntT/GntP/DsdX family permease n=1 Tax=Brevibacterium yomogidense TaxID=946573 RepID=UPI0018DF0EA8|nr:gluconate:H+ symporter [Brevibacterium yomogidense]
MSPLFLIVTAVVAVLLLLVMVIRVQLPAFLSLLIVSIATALVAGIGPADVIPLVMEGLGSTLGNVALLVGLGAMLGAIVEKTGGAEVLARTFTRALGPTRVAPALTIASCIISIPIFFDVAFIILVPIVYSFARAAGMKSPLAFGLPLALMLFVHVTVPPHPGIVGSAQITNGDMGLITLLGLALCVPVGIVGYLVSRRLTAHDFEMLPDTKHNYDTFGTEGAGAEGAAVSAANHLHGPEDGDFVRTRAREQTRKPSAAAVLFVIVLPVLMIGTGTIGNSFVDEGTTAAAMLSLIGAPAFALLVSALVGLIVLAIPSGYSVSRMGELMDGALGPAAIVVFVTGAGGVFAAVLNETGIGEAVADLFTALGFPLILLAFVLAAVLRAAQGSATVSAITTAGLLAAPIAAGDYSSYQVALLNLAIGCGAITLSHINDSGFWIVTRYLGLSVLDGLRTWSVLVTALGVAGGLVVGVAWIFA